jgi:hypothetical protein
LETRPTAKQKQPWKSTTEELTRSGPSKIDRGRDMMRSQRLIAPPSRDATWLRKGFGFGEKVAAC